jgi:hypothetical protein
VISAFEKVPVEIVLILEVHCVPELLEQHLLNKVHDYLNEAHPTRLHPHQFFPAIQKTNCVVCDVCHCDLVGGVFGLEPAIGRRKTLQPHSNFDWVIGHSVDDVFECETQF